MAELVNTLLISKNIDPGYCNNCAIRYASENGHADVVELLLEDERVDPIDDNYVIIIASTEGHTDVVKLLLEDGRANPSDRDNLAIKYASQNGHTDIVQLL